MAEINVTADGFLVPDIETIRKVVEKLKADLADDPNLMAEFKMNPGLVFGQRGLSQKVQLQLLHESDPDLELPGDSSEWCVHTSGCVLTNIF